ncbi:hypothetical protein HZA38_03170 [Candidatus Peregrinibacteria bacterium]|nr:hypothetical protein [Candidatus Peregrinibacteria bacterium]
MKTNSLPHSKSRVRFLFGICIGFSLLLIPSPAIADTLPMCEESFSRAFDKVDKAFGVHVAKLEENKKKGLSGEDSVQLFSTSIDGYNCQLQMICDAVQISYDSDYDLSDNPGGHGKDFINSSGRGCGKQMTVLENGALTNVDATLGNVLTYFFPDDQIDSCREATMSSNPTMSLFDACTQLQKVKRKMKIVELESSLQAISTRKRMGFLMSKLQDLHNKINPEGEGSHGLLELTRRFVTRFQEVITKLSCYVPKTVTVSK